MSLKCISGHFSIAELFFDDQKMASEVNHGRVRDLGRGMHS